MQDGWTVEFYLDFFDLDGGDILRVVEEVRINGKVSSVIEFNFLVLIHKYSKLQSFNDYMPISLFNLIYNVVAKVLSSKLKAFLSSTLSLE